MKPRIIVGVSGASGAAIGVRIVEILDGLGADTHLVVSRAAERTLYEEIGPEAPTHLRARAAHCHAIDDIGASIASGSFPTRGMIVAPCSMRTLSAIAYCLADNLLVRAADVQLKERRPLVLLAREAPLHLGHLRAMTAATEAGALVMPPVPAFYLKPASVAEIIDQIARRAIDLLHVFEPVATQWQGGQQRTATGTVLKARTNPAGHREGVQLVAGEMRLSGVRVRNQTCARVDAILRAKETDNSWWALVRQPSRVEIGDRLRFGDAAESHACLLDFLDADIVAKQDDEILLSFHLTGAVLDDALERLRLASPQQD